MSEHPMGERMASIEAWQSQHEKVCSERYRLLTWVIGAGAAAVVSVAAWGLNKTWDAQQQQMHVLQELTSRPSLPSAR